MQESGGEKRSALFSSSFPVPEERKRDEPGEGRRAEAGGNEGSSAVDAVHHFG